MAKKREARRAQTREAKDIRSQEPQRETRTGPDEYYWPDGVPEPTEYVRVARKYPCPTCKRICDDHASQACRLYGMHKGRAYFQCRVCGRQFDLPIRGE